MKINADLNERAQVDVNSLEWVASPQAGVNRRMLDRDGKESGRATTIVEFAPGSSFPHHVHGAGEEFFVLEGTFSDEDGDYPAGTYVRHAPGSEHSPTSRGGCTILVKLCQMPAGESEPLVIDSGSMEWQDSANEGVQRKRLFTSALNDETVQLVRFHPGAKVEGDFHKGGEEVYVLDGVLEDEHGTYPAGTWLRQPDGSSHSPFSTGGCTAWVKRGHLT